MPPEYYLTHKNEQARYLEHNNDPNDAGYRNFLGRLSDHLIPLLNPGSHGLDFGSGPGPTLSLIMEEAGFKVDLYDIYFAPNESVWQNRYDFVTATEVIEHLYQPRTEIEKLWELLKPGGILAVMTLPLVSVEKFRNWHYKNDLTHVCFFTPQTFDLLAKQWGAVAEFKTHDVVFFQKPRA